MTKLFAIAALVGASWLTPAVIAAPQGVVTIDGAIEPVAEEPGLFTLSIAFDIEEGWHTYGDVGEGSEVETSLEMTLPDGAEAVGDWLRPFGPEGESSGSTIHEGRVAYSRRVSVKDVARGEAIDVTINYQACTSEYCNPPAKKTLSVRIPASNGAAADLFEAPVRVMAQDDFLNADGKTRFLSPALHDLDGDGREELVLGSLMGRLVVHRDLNASGDGDRAWGPPERFLGHSGEPIRTSNW